MVSAWNGEMPPLGGGHAAVHHRQAIGEHLRQGGFALAIPPQQRDPVILIDAQVQLGQDDGVAITR